MSPLSDAAVERLRAAADWPDFVGTRYELIEPLGRGGMGTVFLARDRELDREVAVKVLSDPLPDPDSVARFLAEARILARLEHPGIVPVHDAGAIRDGRVFYAMKRVSGTRLDALAGSDLPLLERLRLFERACEPVAFAHAHGVIHRDLKPENVMVGVFGEVLVMDWGVARVRGGSEAGAASRQAFEQDRPATGAGVVLGTPGYMAPEQARGDGHAADERSDVWSLGALLHFLLAARVPEFDAAGELLPPNGTPERVPRALAAVCRRALAQDPARRYPAVTELAADIRRYLDGEPVRAHRESFLERVGRQARRYQTPLILIAAYLLMRLTLLFFGRG